MRIKLSLHNHSQMSDGYFTVSGLLKVCQDAGYDVVAITDHNTVTVPHPLQLQEVGDLLVLRGVEITTPRLHVICLEPSDFSPGMSGMIRSSAVSWIAHPGLSCLSPSVCQEICEREGIGGIELYNSGISQITGYFDGNQYAVDDLHVQSQLRSSWIEMDVKQLDKETVLGKLKSGDFGLRWKPLDVLFF